MFNQETQCIDRRRRRSALSNDNGGRGWFGTVQVGCDYQIGSNIVIGAFGDYDFSQHQGRYDAHRLAFGSIGEEKLKTSWAAGGRIGWLPFQRSSSWSSCRAAIRRPGLTQVDFARPSAVRRLRSAPREAHLLRLVPRLAAMSTASAGSRACPGRPNIALPTTAPTTSRSCSRQPVPRPAIRVEFAQIRPHHPQRAGLALQLRRPGGRALLSEPKFSKLWRPRRIAGAFAFGSVCPAAVAPRAQLSAGRLVYKQPYRGRRLGICSARAFSPRSGSGIQNEKAGTGSHQPAARGLRLRR